MKGTSCVALILGLCIAGTAEQPLRPEEILVERQSIAIWAGRNGQTLGETHVGFLLSPKRTVSGSPAVPVWGVIAKGDSPDSLVRIGTLHYAGETEIYFPKGKHDLSRDVLYLYRLVTDGADSAVVWAKVEAVGQGYRAVPPPETFPSDRKIRVTSAGARAPTPSVKATKP